MELVDGLRNSVKDHLGWGKPRLDCFIGMLLALLRIQRMDLGLLAVAMDSPAEVSSRYRRLQRFFSEVHFDYDALARLIYSLFGFAQQPVYLTLDRTNWQWGKKNLNILTLAIVYQGAAIPIYWLVLNKKGNSSQRERIAQLNRFTSQFGRAAIKGILGDREFIGEQWWGWLSRQGIPFIMRMKGNQHYLDKQGKSRPVETLFRSLRPGEPSRLRKPRHVSGQAVWLSALRLDSGQLLILASNVRQADPLGTYALRWEIENLFQCLKGRGFHMEDTRITRYYRIKKMMALMAVAFCWAHKAGEWKANVVKPLKIKKHGRPEKSLFRYGLDYLADKLIAAVLDGRDSLNLLLLFLCPPGWIIKNDSCIEISYSKVGR
ncbi:MAG: IS4 family transposase [Thiolinea sp.]